jgi:DNA integrity scanning protein DisA with diadenylate cyclase activity
MSPPRLRRLAEELAEAGLVLDPAAEWGEMVVTEVDYALRPRVHERRVPSVGTIIEPTTPPDVWEHDTQLSVTRRPIQAMPSTGTRLYADGLSSWLIRRVAGDDEWAVFDRPAGSERDLVVLAEAMGSTIVQRHPAGAVRIVGAFGVFRWDGRTWHHEPPIGTWLDEVVACGEHGDRDVIEGLLEFAVHDLGARGIGAILLYKADGGSPASIELRMPSPPALDLRRPSDLAPLRHALSQIDGAAVVDRDGFLRELGVRLVPSPLAESAVDGLRGMRHTSGRRYSFDDPGATVIVVSEDGPVTVLRGGEVIGRSRADAPALGPAEPPDRDEAAEN